MTILTNSSIINKKELIMKKHVIIALLSLIPCLSLAQEKFILVSRDVPAHKLAGGKWMGPSKVEYLKPDPKLDPDETTVKESNRFSKQSSVVEKPSFKQNYLVQSTETTLLLPSLGKEESKKHAKPLSLYLVKQTKSQKYPNGEIVTTTMIYLNDHVPEGEEALPKEEFDRLVKVEIVPARKLPSGEIMLPLWSAELRQ